MGIFQVKMTKKWRGAKMALFKAKMVKNVQTWYFSTRQLAQDTVETPQNQKPRDQVYSQAATGADQPIQQNIRGRIVIGGSGGLE